MSQATKWTSGIIASGIKGSNDKEETYFSFPLGIPTPTPQGDDPMEHFTSHMLDLAAKFGLAKVLDWAQGGFDLGQREEEPTHKLVGKSSAAPTDKEKMATLMTLASKPDELAKFLADPTKYVLEHRVATATSQTMEKSEAQEQKAVVRAEIKAWRDSINVRITEQAQGEAE